MKILWHRVFAFIIFLIVAIVLIRNKNEVAGFLGSIPNIAPGHRPEEQVIGLLAFGIVLVGILAIGIIFRNSGSGS